MDTKVRSGKKPSPITILGWDACGTVEAVGPDAQRLKVGQRVWYVGSLGRNGCNAELQLVDERIVGRAPASLSDAAAAAMSLSSLTAYEGLFTRLGVDPTGADEGRSILLLGGAGSVNSIAIQLAKRVAKLTVVASAGSPASIATVRKLGADATVNHGAPDLVAELATAGFPDGVEFVMVNTEFLPAYTAAVGRLIKPQGVICSITAPHAPIDFGPLFGKSATLVMEMVLTRSAGAGTADAGQQGAALDAVATLVDSGVILPSHATVMTPITAAAVAKAHEAVEAGTPGKIVLAGW